MERHECQNACCNAHLGEVLRVPVSYRPNILLTLFDSLSAVDSGLPGPSTGTPALSGLAQVSASFTSTYAPCPESSPARASLFTGLDPCVHGLWTNGVKLPPSERTFPEILAQAGYATWLVGRRQLAGVANWTTEHIREDEFAHVEWAHGPLHRSRQNAYLTWLQLNASECYARIFASQPNADDTKATSEQSEAISELPDDLSFNHWVGERVRDLMTSHPSDQPFLAVAGFSVGSSMGAEPPQDHDGESLSERALQQADSALEGILDQLVASDRAEDTVVFVTAGRGNVVSGAMAEPMNERSITVPLLMRRAGLERQIVDAPVSTMDIAPTILDVAGLPIVPRMQGKSLIGVLSGSRAPRGWAMSRLRRGSSSQVRNWQTALRANNLKLVVCHGATRGAIPATYRLFDLDADPNELENLAGKEAHAADLEDMIDQMIDARCALEDRTEPRIAEF
ncbi:MAG: sulfatase-like hydrolase/transferase [Albidovulum sp.]|nr:sulfatase-like hydrolase/transferase [Albidovulum sp.]